jgi:hypothetical protein
MSSDNLFLTAMSMRLLAACVPVVEGSACSNKAAAPATSMLVCCCFQNKTKIDGQKNVSEEMNEKLQQQLLLLAANDAISTE